MSSIMKWPSPHDDSPRPLPKELLDRPKGDPARCLPRGFAGSILGLPGAPAPTAAPPDDWASPPTGWTVYRDPDGRFGFWFPAPAALVQPEAVENARIEFSSPAPTNVVEEALMVHAEGSPVGCDGYLSQEFDPASLQSEAIQLGGVDFVRQIHSGAAAGTATVRVAYSTPRGSLCVTLDFILSTYDVANLDPTKFPTPPASVDVSSEMERFEDIAASFRWLP